MAGPFAPLYFQVDGSGFAYPGNMTTSDILAIGKVSAAGVSGVAFDAGNAVISAVGDPAANTDAANKQWTVAQIQAYLTGLSWKTAVLAATTAVLPAYTYANGTLGVGATLTANVDGAWSSADSDGVALTAGTVVTGDRLLVKNETTTNQPYNGIYVLTQQGDSTHPWILTRALDNDVAAEMPTATVAIGEGTTLAERCFVQTTPAPITMGGSNIVWVAGPAATAYTASRGVTLVTNDFRFNPGDGLVNNGDNLHADVNISASNPGLALVGTSPTKTLEALVDGTTLSKATNLHVVYAPDYQTTRTTDAVGVTKGAGIYYSGNGVVGDGDNSNVAKCGIIGVAKASVGASTPAQIGQNGDIITGLLPSDGHVAGTPYYLGTAGTPILAGSLAAAARVILLGYAVASGAASDLEVRIQDMGKKP